MVGPLLLFAAAGTVGIVLLLNSSFQRFSRSEFAALAEADADYIRDTTKAEGPDFSNQARAVQNDFLASHARQFAGVNVEFRRVPPPDSLHDAVTVRIAGNQELTLVRERPRLPHVLLQPSSLGALIAFWALWFVLAWAVTLPYMDAQRFGLLGVIATSLAHEIRNPIAAIRLHAQLLEQTEPSSGLIVYEAAKIEDMLNQWMFLARPEPPRKTDVAVTDVVQRSVHTLEPAAQHARVRIVIEGAPGRRIQADSHRLGQVFHNIILNAIQAMPEGGTLSINATEDGVQFADTGPGFSKTALRRAADTLYSEKEGGMGLGLSVAQKIVRAHDGRLVIGNGNDGGAVVRVVL